MKKRFVSLLMLYGLVSGVCATEKPNILVILSDDQSYPHLGCCGEPAIQTPHLDAMAARGITFHNMFVSSPQCSPSRGTLMTGRSPVACRMSRFGAPLPKDEITFPELLRRDAGYFTGILGRVHHLDGTPHSTFLKTFNNEHPEMMTTASRLDYVDASDQTYIPPRMKDFFDKRPTDRPYFLQVNLNDPHLPWTTGGENLPDPDQLRVPKYLPDLPVVREDLARYMGEVQHADTLVKVILDIVKKRAGLDNTLILYLSDNGYAVPHGKCGLYDPGLHVPMLARWDGVIEPDMESKALVSGEDLAPTLLEVAGLKPPPCMTGVSFLPLLRGRPFPNRRKYIFACRGPHTISPYWRDSDSAQLDYSRCVRDDRYKLIMNVTPERVYVPAVQNCVPHWKAMVEAHQQHKLEEPFDRLYFGPRPGYELYDLEADADEINNLYDCKELQPVVVRLKHALRDKMGTEGDYLPLP